MRSSDPIDRAIFEQGLRIASMTVLPNNAGLVVLLNSGAALFADLSDFPRLKKATPVQIAGWSLVADGTAIGWETLDEHLSLKGFLTAAVRHEVLWRVTGSGGSSMSSALERSADRSGARRGSLGNKAVLGRKHREL